jgi:prolyl oligopeptidase
MVKSDFPVITAGNTTDNYFGTLIADPYRVLEDLENPQTGSWLTAQMRLTAGYFKTQPQTVKQCLTGLWHYPKYSVLSKEGSTSYFFWGLDLENQNRIQNQAVLYRKDTLDSSPVPVLDPNVMDSEGNIAITYQAFSRDGSLVAYAVSHNGSDEQTVCIRNTLTLFDYAEKLENCKTVYLAWKSDHSGLFYNRFVPAPDNSKTQQSGIFWHALGTPQTEDKLIYNSAETGQELTFYPETSYDGGYLILYASHSTEPTNQIYYREVMSDAPFRRLAAEIKAQFVFIGNSNDTFYFQTSWNAPNGQIVAMDLAKPEPDNWQIVVPEQLDILAFVVLANGKLVASYLHSAYHRLKIYNLDGIFEREIPLPPFCSVSGITGKPDCPELFISVESFTCPPTVYRYDLETAKLEVVIKPTFNFRSEEYQTGQVFYPSKDGTVIPMFLIHKKQLNLDGTNPTLLTGYGGFGISQTPLFLISQQLWLEQGGILAVPNIRGGGEFGLDWHEQGRLANKSNCFADFCAAAEWLINNSYTNPQKLAIMGHSNGGLLVAGCLVQAPELFGAVVCRAPLTDMLRYHRLGAGRNWIAEYGCADNSAAESEILQAYSPLHNLKSKNYPAVLMTVPIEDDRVHPAHSLKFIAALQANHTGTKPVLLRVEASGGHGLGNPSGRTIDELSDIYNFLFRELEIM